ncbi:integrase core domain-containing protein [Paracoccus ravus]|uniref:integrase core domain-containing protein n=1 Tax=Paracoccus ravus TaxID=2447760 RepID=UPI00106E90A8
MDRYQAQNAPMESVFSTLKDELVHRTRFRSRREARAAFSEYSAIFYNHRRPHSAWAVAPKRTRIDMPTAMAA